MILVTLDEEVGISMSPQAELKLVRDCNWLVAPPPTQFTITFPFWNPRFSIFKVVVARAKTGKQRTSNNAASVRKRFFQFAWICVIPCRRPTRLGKSNGFSRTAQAREALAWLSLVLCAEFTIIG